MQVTKEPIDPCQVSLTIEVEQDKVVHAVDRAYREYAKYVSVPGFRKGKAPMTFVRQRVPEADVRQRAAEILVEPAYEEALKETDTTPYAPPKLELLQLDLTDKPFIFKAVVPLAPQIEIGPYTGLEIERPQYELSDADVDSQIERMRERAAEYPKAERPVEMSDLVIADVTARTEANPETESRATMIEIGADNIPGFDEQIIGMTVGEQKTFTLPYPDDYPEKDFAGEEGEFTVTVKEVRAKQIPELNDALAEKVSEGAVKTVDALKTDMRARMQRELLVAADREAESRIVERIVADSTISFPPLLTEAEVDDDVKQLLAHLEKQEVTLDDYLKSLNKTREELLAELQDAADKRIRVGLALGEIAEKENLALTDADVDAAIAERAEQQGATPAAMRAFLESNAAMAGLQNRAQTKKVLDFLLAASIIKDKLVKSGETAEDAALEEAAPAAAKKTPAKRGAKKASSNE